MADPMLGARMATVRLRGGGGEGLGSTEAW